MKFWDELREAVWNFLKSRTVILSGVFMVLFGILLYRVFYLQIVKGEYYTESFELYTEREVSLSSTRGNIYDRNGNLLAYSDLSYSVTIVDSGSYPRKTKNPRLNETIYKLIKLIEANGDSVVSDLGIVYTNGHYEYSLTGTSLLRLKADVYGTTTSKLTAAQELASADELMAFLCGEKKYDIRSSYTEEEQEDFGIGVSGYTPEEQLQIATIRVALSANTYQRYVTVTVASGVSDETVAAVQENKNELTGVDVEESSIRVYPDSEYFAPIIGYIGKASADELEELQEVNEDYELNDLVGKAGIEQYMETELQGKKGYEKMYVDSVGRVLEVTEQESPEPGNDVYLTIDKDLQIASYHILEQKLAGILLEKITNSKYYVPDSTPSATEITIPIYDVYYALIDNNVIDTTIFADADATDLEKSIQSRFESRLSSVTAGLMAELNADSPTAYTNLSLEYKNYMSYIVSDVLMGDNQVLMSDAVDTSDATYIAWTTDEVISLKEYLQYAISQNWIDVTKLSADNPYMDAEEIYQAVLTYIQQTLAGDSEFGKMLYKYMLLDDVVSGSEICLLLYEQNVLEYDDQMVTALRSGTTSAYTFMREKIRSLEITPAQLALEPCSGSIMVVDVNTGDTLACVTYPSYDNNRLTNTMDSAYYKSLQNDLSSPFVNRATQENLAPGSTFKPLVAIAGLEEGAITTGTSIYASGIFTDITPSPTCWIYNQYHGHHGNETVTTALRDSCNYFFYEVGYRLAGGRSSGYNAEQGLSVLRKYAEAFGLGEKSGLEIAEYEPQISDEDAVRSAIGQGTNNYSTSHLVRYAAALANSGTVYNLTLLDKLTDTDGTVLEEYQPDALNTVDAAQSSWDAVHTGMRLVAENTTVLNELSALGLNVAGKTGTAQQSTSHPNHALFMGYAPYENPEIAVVVRIANGYTSANAANVAANVFKYYFGLEDSESIVNGTAAESAGQNIAD